MAIRDFKKITSIQVKGIELEDLQRSLKVLTQQRILVGIPQDKANRDDGEPITNAAIGYISEFGSPANNIPARPWLFPGIRMQAPVLTQMLGSIAANVLNGRYGPVQVEKGFNAVGIQAVSGIRKRIADGLEPPLSPVTLWKRASRGDEGAMWELSWRMAGTDAANGQLAKPLIDTGNFIKSISYVVSGR